VTTESQPLRTALRVLTRVVLTILGVIVALILYFVCQGVFSGYPKYHSELLSIIGMILIALTGGIVWIIDQRRIDADD
jgi:hypothetical protein